MLLLLSIIVALFSILVQIGIVAETIVERGKK